MYSKIVNDYAKNAHTLTKSLKCWVKRGKNAILLALTNTDIYFFIASGVGLSPCTAATSGLLYQPQMIGEGDCGAIGGMKIGRGNRSTRRKPTPAPLCPPQIPLDQTRAAAVGSQRLTA
jgi:hypothetical protein